MKLSVEQYNALVKFEPYFTTAVNENWSRYPGVNALDFMLSIYNSLTATRYTERRLNKSCQSCVLHFIQDLGQIYFDDKKEFEVMNAKKTKRNVKK